MQWKNIELHEWLARLGWKDKANVNEMNIERYINAWMNESSAANLIDLLLIMHSHFINSSNQIQFVLNLVDSLILQILPAEFGGIS